MSLGMAKFLYSAVFLALGIRLLWIFFFEESENSGKLCIEFVLISIVMILMIVCTI